MSDIQPLTIRDENLYRFEIKGKGKGLKWRKIVPKGSIHRFRFDTPIRNRKTGRLILIGKRKRFYLSNKLGFSQVRVDGKVIFKLKKNRKRILIGKVLEMQALGKKNPVLEWVLEIRQWGIDNGFDISGFPIPDEKKLLYKTVSFSSFGGNSPVMRFLSSVEDKQEDIDEDILEETRAGFWVRAFTEYFGTGQIWGTKKKHGKLLEVWVVVLTLDPPKSGEGTRRIFLKKRLMSVDLFNNQYHLFRENHLSSMYKKKIREYFLAFILQYGIEKISKGQKMLRETVFSERTNFILGLAGWRWKR